MSGTFDTTGNTSHSEPISVSSGNSYNYYVRCTDGNNPNTTDYTITFSVTAASAPAAPAGAVAIASSTPSNSRTLTAQSPDLGCLPGDNFSRFTGSSCSATIISSPPIFTITNPSLPMPNLSLLTANRTILKTGSRGDPVAGFQNGPVGSEQREI